MALIFRILPGLRYPSCLLFGWVARTRGFQLAFPHFVSHMSGIQSRSPWTKRRLAPCEKGTWYTAKNVYGKYFFSSLLQKKSTYQGNCVLETESLDIIERDCEPILNIGTRNATAVCRSEVAYRGHVINRIGCILLQVCLNPWICLRVISQDPGCLVRIDMHSPSSIPSSQLDLGSHSNCSICDCHSWTAESTYRRGLSGRRLLSSPTHSSRTRWRQSSRPEVSTKFFCKWPKSKYFRFCRSHGKIKDIGTYITREKKIPLFF